MHWQPVFLVEQGGLPDWPGPNNPAQTNPTPPGRALPGSRGIGWSHAADLESERGEFSYPSLLAHGGKLYLAYSHRRSAIKVVTLDQERLIEMGRTLC